MEVTATSEISSAESTLTSAYAFVPPSLRESEQYHVFISYSSTDNKWTHSLINQLEAHGLHPCYHERDFTPGRTVLENMSECINESQKVLLVLSTEFMRSRWCLLEANMSLFRDCLERKPIIPVKLEPDISVPLHLCHLTYLEASDPTFLNRLLRVLCTPNQQLQRSTVVPFQPPSIYNGKALQPLTAVNEEGLHEWDCGQFSDMEVPDQLRLVIEDKNRYTEAVWIINNVRRKVWFRPTWARVLIYLISIVVLLAFVVFTGYIIVAFDWYVSPTAYIILVISKRFASLGFLIQLILWKKDDVEYILRELKKAVGQANMILLEDNVLMGCRSNSKIHLVYISLEGCKQKFAETFGEEDDAEGMFHRAVLFFSCGYACCLAKRHFPFPQSASVSHIEGKVCFCQYVSQQLSRGEWN